MTDNRKTAIKTICISLILLFCAFDLLAEPVLSSFNFTDKVVEQACDKQVVVLGELPSHGEALAFQAKAEIIKKLVSQCQFNALFFEAGIYDFLGFISAINSQQANQQHLNNAIGGFWLTKELAPWREWLFLTSSSGALEVAGLDDQVSATSAYAKKNMPNLVAAAVPDEHKLKCHDSIERNLYWQYNEESPYNKTTQKTLIECAQLAVEAKHTQLNKHDKHIQLRMLENLANFYHRSAQSKETIDRDEMMFDNFNWHLANSSGDKKSIIWTATVHAAREQGELKHKPLGAWLAPKLGDQMYVLGFSAFTGQSSMAGMPAKLIAPAPEQSLETMVNANHQAAVYLDAVQLASIGRINSRLLGSFTESNWSLLFDGVVIFNTEVAPSFYK